MLLNIHDDQAMSSSANSSPNVHPLVLPHIIISDELSGTGANDITDQFWQNASIAILSLTQPMVFGNDKVGSA